MTIINTVCGPIAPDDLGITLVHEHVLMGYPGWEGDRSVHPYDPQAIVDHSVDVFRELTPFGVKSYVDATAIDHGRDADILKAVSEKSEINVICATGYYFEAEGGSAYWRFRSQLGDAVAELSELFHTEITRGIRGSGIKAGVIKVGAGKGRISDYEKTVFTAAANVQHETGVPIITHTQEGTMGPQQAAFLIAAGADPKKIQIGHMGDNLDLDYQMQTLDQGVYVAWDRMGLQGVAGCPMDEDRYTVLIDLIQRGYADQLLLSHDCSLNRLGRSLTIPEEIARLLQNHHPTHLFKQVIPALQKGGVTTEQILRITRENPRRLFKGE